LNGTVDLVDRLKMGGTVFETAAAFLLRMVLTGI
jgi:hypothetical protein